MLRPSTREKLLDCAENLFANQGLAGVSLRSINASAGLSPADYAGGNFTISNLGMFGVDAFDAILPPGQGGILAVAGTREVIEPDAQAVLGLKKTQKMTVTLTCDHRQIYGADAALWLKTLADIMENQAESLHR